MVEGARLESVYTVKAVSRVQIPSSPPVHVSYFSRFPAVPLLLLHLDDSVGNGSFQFIRLITAVLLNKVCLYIFSSAGPRLLMAAK